MPHQLRGAPHFEQTLGGCELLTVLPQESQNLVFRIFWKVVNATANTARTKKETGAPVLQSVARKIIPLKIMNDGAIFRFKAAFLLKYKKAT
jgi:hypothetical protein